MTETEKYQAYANLLRQQIERIERVSIIPAPFEAALKLNMKEQEDFMRGIVGICPTCGNRAA